MEYYENVVKILPQKITFDWSLPFRISKIKQGIGTGFFIDKQGHILTAAHVVEESMKIYVEVPSQGYHKYGAIVVGFCPKIDMAVLKIIDYKPKKIMNLGDSSKTKIGSDTLAVGFALGSENLKVTKGIISGYQNGLFQTDTALNPGNSGGPLLQNGKVIGIVSSGVVGASNVSFVVPIHYYNVVESQFKNNKNKGSVYIDRPRLGIEYNTVDETLMKFYKSKCPTGVYINTIYEGNNPIKASGIKEGNILCSINKLKIDNYGIVSHNGNKFDIHEYMNFIKYGQKVDLVYWDSDKKISKSFKFTDFELPINLKFPYFEEIPYVVFGGIVFMNFSINHIGVFPFLKQYLLPENRQKPMVIITTILPGSTSSNLRVFRPSDFIKSINGKIIKNIDDVIRALYTPLFVNNMYVTELIVEGNRKIVLNLEQILTEEIMLSQKYGYPLFLSHNQKLAAKMLQKYQIPLYANIKIIKKI